MKKSMIVKLENYNSKYFPIKAIWKHGSVYYTAVYETAAQARKDFVNRFYPIKIRFIENL